MVMDPWVFSRSLHRRRRLSLSKQNRTLVFPAPDDAAAGQRTATAGYDRAGLGRRAGPFFVDHHPVIRPAGLMRTRRIGKKRCIPAFSALGPQDRKPCGVSGIEPARRDHGKPPGGHRFAILAVHIKQFGDGRRFGSGNLRRPDSSQSRGERVSNSCQPLDAHAGGMFKPAVVGGGFQVLQGRDAQVLLQMLHPHRAEPGYRLQHRAVRAGCPKPFE